MVKYIFNYKYLYKVPSNNFDFSFNFLAHCSFFYEDVVRYFSVAVSMTCFVRVILYILHNTDLNKEKDAQESLPSFFPRTI